MSAKSILFVESQNQVEKALDLINSQRDAISLVALSPEVQYEFDKLDVNYTVSEDYDLQNRIYSEGQKNYKRLEQFCDWCDAFLWDNCDTLRRLNLDNPTFLHFFHLKILVDGVGLRTLSIKQVLEAEHPETVWYFQDAPQPFDWELIFRESIYSQVIPEVCKQLGIPVQKLSVELDAAKKITIPAEDNVPSTWSIWKNRLRHPVRSSVNLARRIIKYASAVFRSQSKVSDQVVDNRLTLFVVMNYNNLRQVLQFIESEGYFHVVYSNERSDELPSDMAADIRQVGEKLFQQADWDSFLSIDGLSFAPVALPRWRYFMTEGLVDIVQNYVNAEYDLKQTNARIVITATSWGYPHRVILKAARNLGIPTVTYQHGGHYGYIDLSREDYTDFADSDYFFSWGDGVSDFLDSHRYTEKNRAQFVSVGSSSIYNLQRKFHLLRQESKSRNIKSRKLLYISTGFPGNRWYISFNWSDNRYYQFQKELMDILCDCRDVSLLLKLSDSDKIWNPIIPYIEAKQHPDCQILTRTPLADVLPDADLILLDTPTTALLESIVTDVPVIAFDFGDNPFDAPAKELLKKRVWWADSKTEFFDLVKQALADSDWSRWDKRNSEFQKLYATASHGKSVTQYVAQKLVELSKRRLGNENTWCNTCSLRHGAIWEIDFNKRGMN